SLGRSGQERTALRVVWIAEALAGIEPLRDPIVAKRIGMRLMKDGRIDPGECHLELAAVLDQLIALDELRRGRAIAATRQAGVAAAAEGSGVHPQRVALPVADREAIRGGVERLRVWRGCTVQIDVPCRR